MSAPRTSVTIDRLVLRGVPPHQAQALAESLKQELARTFGSQVGHKVLQGTQSAAVIRLGRAPLDAGRNGARRFGTGVARAIAKGIKR